MLDIFTNTDLFLRAKTNATYELIIRLAPIEWMLLCVLIVMTAILGWRLVRFTKPESPRISQLVRHASRVVLLWPSLAALFAASLLWATFFALCFTLSSIPAGFAALHAEIRAIGWGVLIGMFAGAMGFYWLIPGLELPASSSAAPDATPTAMGNYNPEKYFRV